MSRLNPRDLLRWAVAAAILTAALLLLPRLEDAARRATIASGFESALAELERQLPEKRPDLSPPWKAAVSFEGKDARLMENELRQRVRSRPAFELSRSGRPLHVLVEEDPRNDALFVGVAFDPYSISPAVSEQHPRPIRPSAILPPLVAIVLAFASRRLVLSLGVAILLGAALSAGWNPLAFVPHAVVEYGWKATVVDAFKVWIVVFTTVLLGLVGLATAAGGVHAVVDRLSRVARGRRSTQALTAVSGLAIFFDDYANSILVGSTMRPLTDRARISREKLSWLVDSTSAPIAGVALISTWIGYEVGLLGDLSATLGLQRDGYGLFLGALPFRFYCFFALLFVALVVITGRDFGPMLRAERRALQTGKVLRDGARPLTAAGVQAIEAPVGGRRLAHVAVVPVVAVLLLTLLGLFVDGGGLAAMGADPLAIVSPSAWRQAFGAAENSTFVLALAAIAGSLLAFGLVLGHRLLPPRQAATAFRRGASSMWMAVAILVLAWAIKAACDDLGTSELLVAGLQDAISPMVLPLAIFALAAAIAFATGTSWGTMGILLPTAGPLAFHVMGPEGLFLCLAAVLDGAIFGDHASPISDTTVMSSIASGADHLDHVRTQLPYATLCMVVAAGCGYVWNALGMGYVTGWLVGAAGLVAFLFVVGRRAEAVEATPATPAPAVDPQPGA